MIRLGYVSNSSSSSFVIATDKQKVKLEIEIDFNEFDAYPITIKESVWKYIKETTGDYDKKELTDKDPVHYQKMLDAVEIGKTVYIGNYNKYTDTSLVEQVIYSDNTKENGVDILHHR